MKLYKNTAKNVDNIFEKCYFQTNKNLLVFQADSTESKENMKSLKVQGKKVYQ